MIRVGPAGWTYKDWEGIVYPSGRRVDQLAYLVEYFDTIEINSTFYRPCSAKTAESWLRRSAGNPRFKFTAKLLQAFTHERKDPDPALLDEWKEGIKPILEAGKLGAVLVQFPWSFKNEPAGREYIVRLIERLAGVELVLEIRHGSWDAEEVRDLLRHFHVGLCNIDQPLFGKSLRPRSYLTSRLGYFRFHGRNYQDWFREDAGRDARYNYLYSDEQVGVHGEMVEQVASQAEETYAVYNNHYRGQAVVNAIQLRKRLRDRAVKVPGKLPEAYPDAGLLDAEESIHEEHSAAVGRNQRDSVSRPR